MSEAPEFRVIELLDFDGNTIATPAPIRQSANENVKPFAEYNGRVFMLDPWSGWHGAPVVYSERHAFSVEASFATADPSEGVN